MKQPDFISHVVQIELRDHVSAALNRELYKNGRLRKASAKRAKRVVATAAAEFFAERMIVTVDETTQRIDVFWPLEPDK